LLAAATLFSLMVVNVSTLAMIRSSRPVIAHMRETQRALTTVRALLVDAETAHRGFLLTGDPTYLEPLVAAASLPQTLETLRRLTADDIGQSRRAAELDRLASETTATIQSSIELYRKGQREAAIDIVRTHAGKVLLDRAKLVIVEMQERENEDLEDRTAMMRGNFDRATWIEVGAGAGLLVLGLVLLQIHRDLARREVLESALRDQAKFQQQFIGILGHDLRTPLGAISMTAEMLERGSSSSADPNSLKRLGSESAKRVASSAARMGRMIDQLLDLTRARLGEGIPLEPKAGVELNEVVTTAVDELRTFHPHARVLLEADEQVHGTWDPDRLGQVVSNLVANAIHHGEGMVEVRVRTVEKSAVLDVHNSGPPIPADVLPRIFEPFRRTQRSGSHGLGLGLFIATRIVTAHGGRIDVRSAEGEGTTFTVELPLDSEHIRVAVQAPSTSIA
jgi:signal transduction histidine kinase